MSAAGEREGNADGKKRHAKRLWDLFFAQSSVMLLSIPVSFPTTTPKSSEYVVCSTFQIKRGSSDSKGKPLTCACSNVSVT